MTIFNKFTPNERESIYSAANSAIWYSHHYASIHGKSTVREEDYVATLVTNAVPFLVDRWTPILASKGLSLRVSGVFCHGHPQVRGPSFKQVELADLLIIHQYIGKIQNFSKAMLIQAKMSDDAMHRLSSSDQQLHLYSKWPKFEFVSGGLTPGLRDLKESGQGSRYALVLKKNDYPENITWADQCPWAACEAKQLLSADQSFAKVLGNMLFGKDGRQVGLISPKNEWSKTIKELLDITGKKTYTRTNLGRTNTPRVSSKALFGPVMFFAESPSFSKLVSTNKVRSVNKLFFGDVPLIESNEGNDDQPPKDIQGKYSDGGMSTLIIETREIDQ